MGTSPITVASLTANATQRAVILQATVTFPFTARDVPSLQLDNVEFYASHTNDFATATYVGEGNLNFVHSGLTEGDTWYYWAKPRAKNKNYGAVFPASNAGVKYSVPLGNNALINGTVVATVSAGAVTIAIKQLDGVSDPTAANPVVVQFTNSIGATYFRSITSALSMVIPATTKLTTSQTWFNGSTSNEMATGLPFQLYLIAVDKGDGTVLVGVANPQGLPGIKDFFVFPVAPAGIGFGAGQDIGYGPTVNTATGIVAPTPCRTLARLTWPSGIANYSTWIAPSAIILSGPGSTFPGDVVRRMVPWDLTSYPTNGSRSGSATIALNALPTWTNGDFFQNYGFSANSVQPFNFVEQDIIIQASYSVAAHMTMAMFNPGNGSSTNAIKAVTEYTPAGDKLTIVRMYDKRQAGVGNDCSSMSIRFGGDVAGTWRGAATSAVSPILGNVAPDLIIEAKELQY